MKGLRKTLDSRRECRDDWNNYIIIIVWKMIMIINRLLMIMIINRLFASFFNYTLRGFFLLVKGVQSSEEIFRFMFFIPWRQFPLAGPEQKEWTTRKAWVLLKNSKTVGLSFVLTLWRCRPKKHSRGSWQMLLLRRDSGCFFTSSKENRYLTNSTNDFTKNRNNYNY